MVIGEICRRKFACCGPQTSALEAAKLMRQKHVGDIVVTCDMEHERMPIGIVTARDLVVEVLGCENDAANVPLSALVRNPVVIAREFDDLRTVIGHMRVHGVRSLPVVNDHDVLVGVVTFDDVLQALLSDMQALVESECATHRQEQLERR